VKEANSKVANINDNIKSLNDQLLELQKHLSSVRFYNRFQQVRFIPRVLYPQSELSRRNLQDNIRYQQNRLKLQQIEAKINE
jgi:hypothetical protein